jgi:hypothetical protein
MSVLPAERFKWRGVGAPLNVTGPHAYVRRMPEPLVVSISHRLGRDEAVRRIKSGVAGARTQFGHLLTISEDAWEESRLSFHVSALGQAASGLIDVRETEVVLTVQLPWLLAKFAQAASKLIEREGMLMLEKK